MKRELLAREVQGALQTTQAIAISSGYSPELVERQFLNTLHTLVEDIESQAGTELEVFSLLASFIVLGTAIQAAG